MSTVLRGIIHGKIIELEEEAGLPEGQPVSIQIEPVGAPTNWLDRIVIDPGVLSGQPFIKGTRISAEELAGLVQQGQTDAELQQTYGALTAADIEAVRQFARIPVRLRQSFGGWAEDSGELDDFLEWNRQQRKQERSEAGG